MNKLPLEKRISIIQHLIEGNSIRSTERLLGIHRDTVMRLGLTVGENCEALHDHWMRGLTCSKIELDELWSFVGRKQRKAIDPAEGDQYVFTALDASSRALVNYAIGKRTANTTNAFVNALRDRLVNHPTIHSDGFKPYVQAVQEAFGQQANYGQVMKHYYAATGTDGFYEAGVAIQVSKDVISGDPGNICTNGVERSNLTLRMANRRFTRRTNGFSKSIRHHYASVALFVMHYNFCRPHTTTGVTPAMMLGKTDRVWGIEELFIAPPHGRKVGIFTVIEGSR